MIELGWILLEWNRPDSNRLCGIFRFHYANNGGVSRAEWYRLLESPARPPAHLCRYSAGRFMCKALKKQGHNSNHFSHIFLYLALHTCLTLDVFPYSDTYGGGRFVTFVRVGSVKLLLL